VYVLPAAVVVVAGRRAVTVAIVVVVITVRTRLDTAAAGRHAHPVDLYAPDWTAARTREQPPACSARAPPPIISARENPTRTTSPAAHSAPHSQ